MSTAEKRKYTLEEYFAIEEIATQKHEYFEGNIYAMSGGTAAHSRIAGNIYWRLAQQLEGRDCLPNSSDVLVNANSLYTYPDVCVVCPPIEREPAPIETILNPRVIVEVLSPSTERYDRNVKFRHYQQVSSVQEILLVQPEAPLVEHYSRAADGSWLLTLTAEIEGEIALASIGCNLPMRHIYANVEFPTAPFEVVAPPFPPQAGN